MVADFSWIEYNATAGDTTDITGTNLNLGSDNSVGIVPTTHPITAGAYSYSKWIKGYWGGSFTRIENLQFWMSASGTGYVSEENIRCSPTTTGYAGTGTFVTPTNAGEDAQAANNMPESDPGAANVGFNGSLTESITSAGDSDFIVIQASIGSGAGPGATQTKTFCLQYDEL